MRKKISHLILFISILMLIMSLQVVEGKSATESVAISNKVSDMTNEETRRIESWIEKNMKDGKIPGLSIVIVSGDKTIYNKGFGYADIKAKRSVTQQTMFELGSNSKAFTALGILKLDQQGLISLSDPVKNYIPWFEMKYKGKYKGASIDGYVDITLEQLLHHTSGIPFKSIGDIPVADGEDALEKTVRTQVGKKLDFYPGEKFHYATINYDILGLVIHKVSGKPFEEYMKNNVLGLMGLNHTFISREEAGIQDLATGYKLGFLSPREFNAPIYRGNTPAGYFITNAQDMGKWLKIQLGTENISNACKELVNDSHMPDRTVAPSNSGSSYAFGWNVFQDEGGQLNHEGNNPNYSSFITFRPQEKLAVGVLSNMNSAYTGVIGNGIMNILLKKEVPKDYISDLYISLDNASSTIVFIAVPMALVTLWLLCASFMQILRGRRKYDSNVNKTFLSVLSLLVFSSALAFCIYILPDVLFSGLPWSFVRVWAPGSLIIAAGFIFVAITLFCLLFLYTTLFPSKNDKSLFVVIVLSIISGFGNAIIIFIVNEALGRENGLEKGLLVFFAMGIAVYIFGQRLVRIRLLNLTSNLIYNKRVDLIKKILNASFDRYEQIERGKIHAGLNNDTETISNFANITISAVTSLITLFCCFVYLGIINIYGLLFSLLVILMAAGLYFLVGSRANRLWEQTRDIQNLFFKFINDLIGGFKELKLHNKRRSEFEADMLLKCKEYRDKRIKGDMGFANAFIIGELLFTFVIGMVAFLFPVIFKNMQTGILRNYIFIFLYMTGPVHAVLNSIPEIIRIRISFNRLNDFVKELDLPAEEKEVRESEDNIQGKFSLELKGIEYSYKNKSGDIFMVGPIDYQFNSSEITFITGGNGSGKSTLAKMITGLYVPDSGKILLNNNKIDGVDLNQKFSAIFNDFYLFEKLYGIDYNIKEELISTYLKVLQIEDKLQIDNGVFSTTMLSTGQRKRLSLLVSYLEDRPFYLFDEWAADQDPEFKKFFYYKLLHDLKQKGKCVIAITHDDKYFHVADKVIKLDAGKIDNDLHTLDLEAIPG